MKSRRGAWVFATIALALAGCGGGSTPTPAPTPFYVPSSATIPLGGVTPSGGVGIGTQILAGVYFQTLSSATSATLTVTVSTSLPSGAPALGAGTPGLTPVAYVTLVPSAAVTIPGTPEVGFNLPQTSTVANAQYYLAYLAPGAPSWVEPSLGPATPHLVIETVLPGTTPSPWAVSYAVAFPGGNQPVSLGAGQSYNYALYTVTN